MKEISIDSLSHQEALRYLGCKDYPNADFKTLIELCEKEVLANIEPRYVYQKFDIIRQPDYVEVVNTPLKLYGNDIKNHLKGCNSAILMCATISAKIDRIIRVAEVSNMAKAMVLDSLSSVAIERVCNTFDTIIKQEFPQYFQTWRFSAGYGDFPIDVQRTFIEVLNAQKRIGVCVTDTNIMTPRKSVTAVMGLSTEPIEKRRLGCASCNLKDTCQYRAKNLKCSG